MSPDDIANAALIPVIVVFGIIAVRGRRAGRLRLGFSPRHGGVREFAAGAGLACAAILMIFAIELATGLVRVTAFTAQFGQVGAYLVYLLILGAIEEMAFRGLLLPGLALATRSAWIGTGITALLVAVPYLFGTGANALTFLSAVLSGLMYGLAYVATGRIWAPIGMRVAWNFVQGPVLGFTVSGTTVGSVSLLRLTGNEPAWLAGGAYGPEGGTIAILVRLVIIAMLTVWITKHRGTRGPLLGPPTVRGADDAGRSRADRP